MEFEDDYLDTEELFGAMLEARRAELGIKAGVFANALNVHSGNIKGWEKAEKFPSEDKLPEIARIYGLDLEELKETFRVSKDTRKDRCKVRASTKSGNGSGRVYGAFDGEPSRGKLISKTPRYR